MAVAMGVLFLLSGCQEKKEAQSAKESTSESQVSDESTVAPENEVLKPITEHSIDYKGVMIDKTDWQLILANKEFPVNEVAGLEIQNADNNQSMDQRIFPAYESMKQAAQADGIEFLLISGYRSVEAQQGIYDQSIATYLNQGYSEEEAKKLTLDYIAYPGTSEHQTGLALDIVTPQYNHDVGELDDRFDAYDGAVWLKENAHKYGFVMRYPTGKEDITGYAHEGWHYRYVGIDHATQIYEEGLTLEEYLKLVDDTVQNNKK